jgi:putative peptidoglycan lipid II flippase
VQLVFAWHGGQFTHESTVRTARAVAFYAPGLVFFSLYKVFVPAFYAFKDTKTPVRIGVCVVALNLVLNVVSVVVLPLEYKHAGLAFSTVVASAVNCAILGYLLHRRLGSPGWSRIAGTAVRVLFASLVMGIVTFQAHALLAAAAPKMGLGMKMGQLVAVPGGIAAGVAVYAALALMLCRQEVRDMLGLKRRSAEPQDAGNGV